MLMSQQCRALDEAIDDGGERSENVSIVARFPTRPLALRRTIMIANRVSPFEIGVCACPRGPACLAPFQFDNQVGGTSGCR